MKFNCKYFLLFTLFFILSFDLCEAANIEVIIDERIELTSIAFRLAGAKEYVTDCAPTYLKEVDDYFSKYKNHPLIKYIKELRDNEQLNIGYSNVAYSALLFDIREGHVKPNFNKDSELPKYKYWPKDSFLKYLKLLDEFYVYTKFEWFWNKHEESRNTSKKEAEEVINNNMLDLHWFEEFFAQSPKQIYMYLALANGQHNYGGINDTNPERIELIIGCNCEIDGAPTINRAMMDVIPHELCHSCGDSVARTIIPQIISSFNMIYPYICQQTKSFGYGDNNPEVAALESLTELFANVYLSHIGYKYIGYVIARDDFRGYLWMADALRFMKNFLENREQYPSIVEFLPQLVAYYNELPDRFEFLMNKFLACRPYVESTYPANGSTVSSNLREIKITLSQPMINAFGCGLIDGYEQVKTMEYRLSEDHRTFILKLDKPLEPGKQYGLLIDAPMLVSEDNFHRVSNNYELYFNVE
ncbi:MAG: DUF4932 domain-containing protein [Bacteroidales bacterium]|nr:DUF4932 domain-containing protein [Candidatus Egerieousia equi]